MEILRGWFIDSNSKQDAKRKLLTEAVHSLVLFLRCAHKSTQ